MSTLDQLRITPINLSAGGLFYTGVPLKDLLGVGYGLAEAVVLPAVKDWLKGQIDARAEDLRAVIATAGSGQAMEYQRAEIEAFDALAAAAAGTAIDPTSFPMLAATVGLDIDPSTKAPATDVLGVARAVKLAAQEFASYGAAIRRARLFGKAAVEAATSIEAAAAAFDAVAWPSV